MVKKEQFASRWGIIFAGMGMAIGTGNIWRFPRIVSQSEGGAFIIAWLLFLFLWSIPLLVIEISIGKHTRLGVVGSFGKMMGTKFTWMGSFVAFVTAGITFYYSVVTGWCLKYFFATVFQGLIKRESSAFWSTFTSSWEPVVFHLLAIGIGSAIIFAGVVKGIERVNKILIPSLFLLLLIACIRALTLPSAMDGLNFLFSPNFSKLTDYKIWLNALSQSAWSTGAGWGLILTYAVYTHQKQRPLLTATTIGFGNNLASILAAMAIIPTVFSYFAMNPQNGQSIFEVMKSDNQGLTFIWIPRLFSGIPAGDFFLALFFLALTFAAFSSLIAMLEMITRIFMDFGLKRKKAIWSVAGLTFALGLPSAISMGFFNNQDWVWGLGLMTSGFFFTLVVIRTKPKIFRKMIINGTDKARSTGRWFDWLVYGLLPLQFLAMLFWWFWQSYSDNPKGWLNIFSSFSVGTVLFQWIMALLLFIMFNRFISKKIFRKENEN